MRSVLSLMLLVIVGCAAIPLPAYQSRPEGDTLDARLIQAVKKNDVTAVKLLLSKHANVDARDNDKNTALMCAASDDHLDLVKLLISHGANVNAKNADGECPLILTVDHPPATQSSVAILQVLLEHRAQVHVVDHYHSLALSIAANGGNAREVKMLLAHGAQVNARDSEGQTALMCAIDPDISRLLLAHAADVNAADKNGFTALMEQPSPATARVLLEAGADVNASDRRGMTVLMHMVDRPFRDPMDQLICWPETVKILLQHGVDFNARDDRGDTALSLAQRLAKQSKDAREAEIVRLLKASGAR